MLIALTISSVILTALMSALNASFKAYQSTTEAVSTHVIARNAMARMSAMIRLSNNISLIGSDGNTYFPVITGSGRNVAGNAITNDTDYTLIANPNIFARGIRIDLGNVNVSSTDVRRRWATFRIMPEQVTGPVTSYAIEYREDLLGTTNTIGTYYPILRGLKRARFEMDFDIGTAKARRVTMDLVVAPNDYDDAIDYQPATPGGPAYRGGAGFKTKQETEHIRLVGSASPRRFEYNLN
jgi:hypothetical protein